MEGFAMPPNDDPSDPALIARWALGADTGGPSGPSGHCASGSPVRESGAAIAGGPAREGGPAGASRGLAIVPTSEPGAGAPPLFDPPPV